MKIELNISKLKKVLSRSPSVLAKKAPLFLLCVILVDISLGAIVYYQYSFSLEKRELKLPEKSLTIQEQYLSEILEELKVRQERFEKTDSKIYPDLFRRQELIEPEKPVSQPELTE